MTVDGPPSSPSPPPAAAAAARYICTHLVATDGQADRVEAHLRAIGLRAFRSVQRSHALPSEMEISSSVNFSTTSTTPRSRGGKGEEDTVEDTVGRCSYHRATASGITNHLLLICPVSSSDNPYPGTASSLLSTLSPYSPTPAQTQQQQQRGPTVAFDAHSYLLRQISLRLLSPPSSSCSSAPSISYSTTFLYQGSNVARLLQRWARDLLMNKGEPPAPLPSSGVGYYSALSLDGAAAGIGLSAAQAQREVEALMRETVDSRAGADSAYAQRKAEEERAREREKSERLAMTSLRRNFHPLAPLPPTVLVPRTATATAKDSSRGPSTGDGAPESKHGASVKDAKDSGKDAATRTAGPGAHHRLFSSKSSPYSSTSSSARHAQAHGKSRRWNAALPPLLRLASGSMAAPPARESRSRQIQALCEALGLEHDLVCAPVAPPSPSFSPSASSHAKSASASARTSRAGGKREEDEGEAPSTDGYTLSDADAEQSDRDREKEKEKLAHALGDLGKLGAKLLTVGSGSGSHTGRHKRASYAGGATRARNARSRKEREKQKQREHKVTVAAAVAALALRGAACGPIGARPRARAGREKRGEDEESFLSARKQAARALRLYQKQLLLAQEERDASTTTTTSASSPASSASSSSASDKTSSAVSAEAAAAAQSPTAESPLLPEEMEAQWEELEEELTLRLEPCRGLAQVLRAAEREVRRETWEAAEREAQAQAQADEQQALAEAEEEEESKRRKRSAGALLGARGWRRARL